MSPPEPERAAQAVQPVPDLLLALAQHVRFTTSEATDSLRLPRDRLQRHLDQLLADGHLVRWGRAATHGRPETVYRLRPPHVPRALAVAMHVHPIFGDMLARPRRYANIEDPASNNDRYTARTRPSTP